MIISCLQWWMTSFSSVHFVCFGEERNMHKCATISWSSCLWKLWWAGVKHWRTAPHRFYVYRKPISSPRSRNLKVIKKMCTFEVHLCMMYGQSSRKISNPKGNCPLLLKMMRICIFPLHCCSLYFRKDCLHVHF